MWQYFVLFYERFLFLPRPRFYLNLIYIFSPFSVLLIYLSCFGFSYTEYHGPTYCIPNSTGDILLSNDNHEKSFQEFKQHPQAFKYSISQPKDEFWQRCQIYGVCGCIVVLGPPMQKKSNNSSRFLRSIEWKDGRNPLHSVYFLSVQLGKKKLTMSHNRYLLLKRDNSNECNRNFTMCCFMNVNKSFWVVFLSCFPFRPQLGQYPNNMRPLNPKSIHLPILHEFNLLSIFLSSKHAGHVSNII